MISKTIAICLLFGSCSAQDLTATSNVTTVDKDGEVPASDSNALSTSVLGGEALSTNVDSEERVPCTACTNGTPYNWDSQNRRVETQNEVLDRCISYKEGSDFVDCSSCDPGYKQERVDVVGLCFACRTDEMSIFHRWSCVEDECYVPESTVALIKNFNSYGSIVGIVGVVLVVVELLLIITFAIMINKKKKSDAKLDLKDGKKIDALGALMIIAIAILPVTLLSFAITFSIYYSWGPPGSCIDADDEDDKVFVQTFGWVIAFWIMFGIWFFCVIILSCLECFNGVL